MIDDEKLSETPAYIAYYGPDGSHVLASSFEDLRQKFLHGASLMQMLNDMPWAGSDYIAYLSPYAQRFLRRDDAQWFRVLSKLMSDTFQNMRHHKRNVQAASALWMFNIPLKKI